MALKAHSLQLPSFIFSKHLKTSGTKSISDGLVKGGRINQPKTDLLSFARATQDFILSEVGCHNNKTPILKTKHPGKDGFDFIELINYGKPI